MKVERLDMMAQKVSAQELLLGMKSLGEREPL
jgi:hypothetical protein